MSPTTKEADELCFNPRKHPMLNMATQCLFLMIHKVLLWMQSESPPEWRGSNTLILNQLNSVMIGQIAKMLQLVYSRVRVQEISPTPISKGLEFLPTQ